MSMSGILVIIFIYTMLKLTYGFNRNRPIRSLVRSMSRLAAVREFLIFDNTGAGVPEAARILGQKRPEIELIDNKVQGMPLQLKKGSMLWSLHQDWVQLDCVDIEDMYLGRHKLDSEETAAKWNEIISTRRKLFASTKSIDASDRANIPLGDGGKLQAELDTAIRAVQRASFMSRSLQHSLILNKRNCNGEGSLSKDDKSPVTIADFAVQALIIDAISKVFPNDKFIAEEDSELLRKDERMTSMIVDALNLATDTDEDHDGLGAWDEERLYRTIDGGGFVGKAERVWVLDPIDGTKGFMRGEHYCIALALLVDGSPQLSALGCPNVQLIRVLGGVEEASRANVIIRGTDLEEKGVHAYPSDSGSLFFAVSGQGAFARALAMPPGAAHEVNVQLPLLHASNAVLCESVEASHGNRRVTSEVFSSLEMSKDYVRLDGQCKYAIVGAGAAHGNMRLPPSGYIEKIWDHAPGAHFVTEAGGIVSDLQGKPLDFSHGRFLPATVTGIVASNSGKLHASLLRAITKAKQDEGESLERTYLD